MSTLGHIGVVGGGAWGTALACLARRAGRRVTLWSRDPSVAAAIAHDRSNPIYLPGLTLDAGIEAASDLAALGACDAVLLVCPAQAVRELAARLTGSAPVVICAKGIEASSGLLMPEVLAEVLPGRPIAMLSGPSFAEEVARGLPTAVSIATADPALGETLAGALAGGAFRPYWTHDVLGVALGGYLTARWGWQAAFGVVGVPGLVLALLFLLVRDYRTVPLTDPEARRLGVRGVLRGLLGPRTALLCYAGGALQLLTVSTVYVWLPSYLNRFHGLPTDRAGLMTALVLVLGSVGIVLWGYVADRVGDSSPRRKLMVPAACLVLAALLLSMAFGLMPPGGLQFALIAAGGFMMTAASGTVPAAAIDVIHPGLRATGAAMVAVVQNLFGLALGPMVTGVLSDAYGLATALAVMPAFCLASAAVLMAATRVYPAELNAARTLAATTMASQ